MSNVVHIAPCLTEPSRKGARRSRCCKSEAEASDVPSTGALTSWGDPLIVGLATPSSNAGLSSEERICKKSSDDSVCSTVSNADKARACV